MNEYTGRLQDILEPTVKNLRPNQTFRIGGTQIRRLSAHCLQIERYGSVSVTVHLKPVWEVVGLQLVIGGEFTQCDHRLYFVPTFNAIVMKQRFADEKLANTIIEEVLGVPCLDCCGSGVVGIQRYDDGGPNETVCLGCDGKGVIFGEGVSPIGQAVTSGFLEFIPY